MATKSERKKQRDEERANELDRIRHMDEYNRAYFGTEQYRQVWWGASRLALAIIRMIDNTVDNQIKEFKNPLFIKNVLEFLLKSSSDMLTFILNGGELSIICAKMSGKGGSTLKPYRLIHYDETTPEISKTEFISEDEYKWRETARILMDALNKAVTCVSVMSGRTENEVLNGFLGGRTIEEIPPAPTGKKLITESGVGEITFEIRPDSNVRVEDITNGN